MGKRSESRIKTKAIPVRVTPEQKAQVRALAASCLMSSSAYLLQAGLGITPSSKVDQNAIQELAALRADLGRLGGLFKGWLAGSFPQPAPTLQTSGDVIRLRREIEATQKLVVEAVNRVSGKAGKP